MILNLKIVRVNSDYCDYLRKYDNKVSYNKFEKELRPFIGILFKIDDCEYFAPLSSPKPKHNNMIPVTESNYKLVDLNKETLTLSELKYQRLLREQLDWLNANYHQVKNKSIKLYTLYNQNKLSENIKARCCNFKLLEKKCKEYNK